MTEPIIVLESAAMAAFYSMLVYSRRYSVDREDFRPYTFAATVAVGAAVGISMALAGGEVTQAEMFARLAALTGTVVIVENMLKLGWKNVRKAT